MKNQQHDLIVEKVLPSPFTHEMNVHDRVVQINGKPACNFLESPYAVCDRYVYECLSHSDGKPYTITSSVPIAAELAASSEYLVEKQTKHADHEDLFKLWERSEWNALKRGVEASQLSPWISKTLGFILRRDIYHTPDILFLGILAFQHDDRQQAHKLITGFAEKGMSGYTVQFHALAYYYLAMLSDNQEDRHYYLSYANECNASRSLRLNQLLELQGVVPEQLDSLKDSPFPTDFYFEHLPASGTVESLDKLLTEGEKELTPICVMPGYRANLPYDERMRAYLQMFPYFRQHINPMVVLASDVDNPITKYWLDGERAVRSANLPLLLLDDSNHDLACALEQNVSPEMYVVNRDRTIVYQGALDTPLEYWKLLS